MKKVVVLNASDNSIHVVKDKNMYVQIEQKLNQLNKDSMIVGRDQNNQLIIAEKTEVEDV
jgi:hypothetical protein